MNLSLNPERENRKLKARNFSCKFSTPSGLKYLSHTSRKDILRKKPNEFFFREKPRDFNSSSLWSFQSQIKIHTYLRPPRRAVVLSCSSPSALSLSTLSRRARPLRRLCSLGTQELPPPPIAEEPGLLRLQTSSAYYGWDNLAPLHLHTRSVSFGCRGGRPHPAPRPEEEQGLNSIELPHLCLKYTKSYQFCKKKLQFERIPDLRPVDSVPDSGPTCLSWHGIDEAAHI
jgi:hypothetical protein